MDVGIAAGSNRDSVWTLMLVSVARVPVDTPAGSAHGGTGIWKGSIDHTGAGL